MVPTKAAAHWLTQRINGEDEKLIDFAVHPGIVQTDPGNRADYLKAWNRRIYLSWGRWKA